MPSCFSVLLLHDPQHTLHLLLPSESTIRPTYDLRPRAHKFTLPDKHCALDNCNFITRMLYANCYWHCNSYKLTLFYSSCLSYLQLRFVICIINEELSWDVWNIVVLLHVHRSSPINADVSRGNVAIGLYAVLYALWVPARCHLLCCWHHINLLSWFPTPELSALVVCMNNRRRCDF